MTSADVIGLVHYDHRAISIYKAAVIGIEINPARFPIVSISSNNAKEEVWVVIP